ncbi:hypothetical protein [Trichormus variabilis]|uniref:Uncharacterized protein n=1 Tax=Trichormus variabilis NIES-23 TaxID=1973479 RepID=A0A1Z4KX14_ANAVA|nr:hypothetical protein [Trichormus variabilis]MBD2352835.1 hypothetical protein [Trichormus variabilis FACHB-171]BAY73580.1 hypothetical protein NIES23_64320 [Trichormus variabilis NIES-23]
MSKITFTNGSKIITTTSLIITLGAIFSYFRVPENHKPLAVNVIFASLAVAGTNKLLSENYEVSANEQLQKIVKDAVNAVGVSESMYKDLLAQKNDIEITLEKQKQLHQATQENYLSEVASLASRLHECRNQLQTCNQEKEVLQSSLEAIESEKKQLINLMEAIDKDNIKMLIKNFSINLEEHLQNIKASMIHHAKNPDVNLTIQIKNYSIKFDNFVLDIDETFKHLSALPDMDFAVSEIIRIYDDLILLKHQWAKTLNIRERLALKQTVKILQDYQANESNFVPVTNAKKYGEALTNYHKQSLEELYQKSSVTDTNLQIMRDQIQELLAQLDEKNLIIADMEKRMNSPMAWRLPTREDLKMGNVIIGYFQSLGFILDRATADYKGHESILSFHIDRNDRIPVVSEFNAHSEKLQQLAHTLKPVEFTYDGNSGLLNCKVVISNKSASNSPQFDPNKLWKSSEQFTKIVGNWERVRITGQSQAGKSPTAENLAIAIMSARKDAGQIKLYNPQHDSRKNHFTIPVTGVSHDDSIEALSALAEVVNNAPPQKIFNLYIFDEIDSTLTNDETTNTSKNIKDIIKQASHKNIGVIFTGQNANAKQYKGFDRSDWNNAINLHIGANIYDAINNSNQFTADECNKLKAKADQLKAYCEQQNAMLGLDIADPAAYRFALVIEPSKAPYFIELPDFGQYTFDGHSVTNCPHCGSSNTVGHGLNRKRCKDCGKTF